MKNLFLIAKVIGQRRDDESPYGPIFRVWVVSVALYAVFILAFQLLFAPDILIRECLYVWLASVPITFIGMVGSYAMIGAMHGRLGFRHSRRQASCLAIATGAIFAAGFFVANYVTIAFLPPLYLVIVAILLPALQFILSAVAGDKIANAIEHIVAPTSE